MCREGFYEALLQFSGDFCVGSLETILTFKKILLGFIYSLRKRETHTDTHAHIHRDRQREKETERDRDRETERQKQRERRYRGQETTCGNQLSLSTMWVLGAGLSDLSVSTVT